MPRSGTSLVEQILASHPEVFGAGELELIHHYASTLTPTLGAKEPYPLCLSHINQTVLEQFSTDYIHQLEKLDPTAKYVTDKMPQNFLHLGFIALLFPNAKVIHCIRNSLDTCLSCYFQPFIKGHAYSYNLTHLGAYYQQYQRIMRYWKALLPLDIFEIEYESLIEDMETQSRRLLEYCGIAWDDACLKFYETKRVVKTASYQQVRKPIYKSSVNRSDNYKAFIEPLIEAMKRPYSPVEGEVEPSFS